MHVLQWPHLSAIVILPVTRLENLFTDFWFSSNLNYIKLFCTAARTKKQVEMMPK